MSADVITPCSRARASSGAAASPPMNSGPPRWRCVAASISSAGRSSGPKLPLAPTTWNAGRSPLGRMGRTLADVWTSSRAAGQEARGGLNTVAAREEPRVHALALEQREQHVAGGVGADRSGALDLGP